MLFCMAVLAGNVWYPVHASAALGHCGVGAGEIFRE